MDGPATLHSHFDPPSSPAPSKKTGQPSPFTFFFAACLYVYTVLEKT